MDACKRIQIDQIFITLHKIYLQLDQRPLNQSPYILNRIEEKVGNCLKLIGTGKDFLNRTPIAKVLWIINKWDLMKLKSFSVAKDIMIQAKWQTSEWKMIFADYTSGQGLVSVIYKKELKKPLDIKKTNNQQITAGEDVE